MKKQKVFCIGFHKTGTTSIGKALNILGYKNCHGAGELREKYGDQNFLKMLQEGDLGPIIEFADLYDSFNDNPWFMLYEKLYESFPGAYFILTTRSPENWLKSALQYFGHSKNPIRKWIYGASSVIGNEKLYLNRYQLHNDDVINYFNKIQKDLLVMNFEEGDSWDKLCTYLNCDVPQSTFPHLNQSGQP